MAMDTSTLLDFLSAWLKQTWVRWRWGEREREREGEGEKEIWNSSTVEASTLPAYGLEGSQRCLPQTNQIIWIENLILVKICTTIPCASLGWETTISVCVSVYPGLTNSMGMVFFDFPTVVSVSILTEGVRRCPMKCLESWTRRSRKKSSTNFNEQQYKHQ